MADGSSWVLVGNMPEDRGGHTSVVYDGKIWVIGGLNSSSATTHTILSSIDGIAWTQVSSNFPAGLSGNRHTSESYDNKMWIIGGMTDAYGTSDAAYYSTDGITWTPSTVLPVARRMHSSVIYPLSGVDRMWVIGGQGAQSVYYWTAGSGWTNLGNTLPAIRFMHSSVAFDGKIWVIGGYGAQNVYSSVDGVNWTDHGNVLPKTVYEHRTVVYDGKMWILGGNDSSTNTMLRSVYSSVDGVNWIEAGGTGYDALPEARQSHSSVIYDNRVWVIGGYYPPGSSVRDTVYATEQDIPVCWNYTARYKNSNKLFKLSGPGLFPKNLRVPSNVDELTGKMIDDGIIVSPKKYTIN